MDFPAYVPAAVRAHITHYLEGERDRSIPGYIELLAGAESQLAGIDGKIESCIRWGKDDYLPGLRKEKADAAEHRDRLAADVDCLRRLAHDARMHDAFALLTREFTDDRQWRNFIHSAWSAKIDFSKFRDDRKRATELKSEIAGAAETLAKLIRQFSDIGISGPDVFYSIPELLRKTDNHDRDGHNLHMWRAMRSYVLGEPPTRDVPEGAPQRDSSDQSPAPEIVRVFLKPSEKQEIDPVEEARDTLRYAWGTAPEFSRLLDTVAEAAELWEPSESGFIGAAIQSRQRSAKTEYIRAFGNLLTDTHSFALTTPIMQAMATVANVVINLPDVDVTNDDVRKALVRLGGERLENSGEK
ncbi:MAG: hypothetical protein IV085_05890 [Thiobacillus sp.]|nr:hypothetical protein [Thiobacillus sp.]